MKEHVKRQLRGDLLTKIWMPILVVAFYAYCWVHLRPQGGFPIWTVAM